MKKSLIIGLIFYSLLSSVWAGEEYCLRPEYTHSPPFFLSSEDVNNPNLYFDKFRNCDSHNTETKDSCVQIINQVLDQEANPEKYKNRKGPVAINIFNLPATKYIPENTIVKRVTQLPGISQIPIMQNKYMLVEVVKAPTHQGRRSFLEEVRRSNLGGKNITLPPKDSTPVENGDIGFLFVGQQRKEFLKIATESSLYAPNNPFINMGLDKNGEIKNSTNLMQEKNRYLPETVFTFNSHSRLWFIPGFYEALQSGAVAVNAAIELVVGQDGIHKGMYKYRLCGNGEKRIEYFFKFTYPDQVSDVFPEEFPMPVTDVFLENLTVVYKKDYNYLRDFLKSLDLAASFEQNSLKTKHSYNFSDLIIWPNKHENGLTLKEFQISNAVDERDKLPSYVQIPTRPFLEKVGVKGDNSYRLRAWGPFNSVHYVSSTTPITKNYDLEDLYSPVENSFLMKALAEYHGDHFHRVETVCNFMYVLREYIEKIQKKELLRTEETGTQKFQCQMQPFGVSIGDVDPENGQFCPRLQWGDLYGPQGGDHNTHYTGHCSDYRLIRKDLLHLSTSERTDYDPDKTNVFVDVLRGSGATIVANDFLDIFQTARNHWGGHSDHLHVCFEQKDENRKGYDFTENSTIAGTCKSFLSEWDKLQVAPQINSDLPPAPQTSLPIKYCHVLHNELGQDIWSQNINADLEYVNNLIKITQTSIKSYTESEERMSEIFKEASEDVNFGRNVVGIGTTLIGSIPMAVVKMSLRAAGTKAAFNLGRGISRGPYHNIPHIPGMGLASKATGVGSSVLVLENLILSRTDSRQSKKSGRTRIADDYKNSALRSLVESIDDTKDLGLAEYIDQTNKLKNLIDKEFQSKINNMPGEYLGAFLNWITLGGQLLRDLAVYRDRYATMRRLHEVELENYRYIESALKQCPAKN